MSELRADAARNHAAILRVADDLLQAASAPADVSMEAVASAAGVAKGTLFRRFGDREGLISAVVAERMRPLKEAIESGPPPLGPDAPPAERILAILDAIVVFKTGTVTLHMADESSRTSPYTTSIYAYVHELMTRLLMAAGADVDADLTAHLLLSPTRADFIAHLLRTQQRSPDEIRALVARNARSLMT
ncbi:MAG TPA: helix-turn-helix domain-containing protein [Pseudonocardiaceae bacterium]